MCFRPFLLWTSFLLGKAHSLERPCLGRSPARAAQQGTRSHLVPVPGNDKYHQAIASGYLSSTMKNRPSYVDGAA